jgi:hypothetical protein
MVSEKIVKGKDACFDDTKGGKQPFQTKRLEYCVECYCVDSPKSSRRSRPDAVRNDIRGIRSRRAGEGETRGTVVGRAPGRVEGDFFFGTGRASAWGLRGEDGSRFASTRRVGTIGGADA